MFPEYSLNVLRWKTKLSKVEVLWSGRDLMYDSTGKGSLGVMPGVGPLILWIQRWLWTEKPEVLHNNNNNQKDNDNDNDNDNGISNTNHAYVSTTE
jgi:hypothetical protein